MKKKKCCMSFTFPLTIITLGVLLLLDRMQVAPFQTFWPALLVVFGVSKMVECGLKKECSDVKKRK